jgi:hypothetical protein
MPSDDAPHDRDGPARRVHFAADIGKHLAQMPDAGYTLPPRSHSRRQADDGVYVYDGRMHIPD